MSPDHFDVFGTDHDTDEHGSSSDYWDHYADVIADAFAITAEDETPFLLTDAELSELSEDVDSIPPGDWDDAIADSSILPPLLNREVTMIVLYFFLLNIYVAGLYIIAGRSVR
jgi:hypothetical protein